jgi:hypothetical protein
LIAAIFLLPAELASKQFNGSGRSSIEFSSIGATSVAEQPDVIITCEANGKRKAALF